MIRFMSVTELKKKGLIYIGYYHRINCITNIKHNLRRHPKIYFYCHKKDFPEVSKLLLSRNYVCIRATLSDDKKSCLVAASQEPGKINVARVLSNF